MTMVESFVSARICALPPAESANSGRAIASSKAMLAIHFIGAIERFISTAPRQLFHLRVFGMLHVKRTQLDFHAVVRKRGAHPAARPAFLARISRRRQVD